MKRIFSKISSLFKRTPVVELKNEELAYLSSISQYQIVLGCIRKHFATKDFTSQDLIKKLHEFNIEITPKQVYRLMNKFRCQKIIQRYDTNPPVYSLFGIWV
jgi:hypothetical protein